LNIPFLNAFIYDESVPSYPSISSQHVCAIAQV
jgi:hypothetical protein